jgi:hypothetical protein
MSSDASCLTPSDIESNVNTVRAGLAGISRRSKHFLNELGSLAVYEKVAFRVYSAKFRVLIVSLLPAGAVDPWRGQ